jgi:hypothetical protein
MKRSLILFAMVTFLLMEFGCEEKSPTKPNPNIKIFGLTPGGYYSFAFSESNNGVYGDFILISQGNGLATPVWSLSGQQSWVVDPPSLWGPSPVGFAFDLDASMYTTIGVYSFEENNCKTRFARIDPATGQVTYIGDPVPLNYCGPDIDSHGNYFVCGMGVPPLGYINGTGRLYKVDKVSGEFTEIGPLNVEITDWMDLAFDSHDQLFGTTQNKLFKIDTATGEITETIPIVGVPGDPPTPPNTLIQEIMSIAFDEHDVLYGTGMNVEWDTGHGSPVVKINTTTGQATFLGYTEQVYNHGGDILPTKVRIAHRQNNGKFKCMTIKMGDLESHLAHGDYVPGTAGHDYECP